MATWAEKYKAPVGSKPGERFRSGMVGQMNPMMREMGRIPAVNNMLGKMSSFTSKMPFGGMMGGLFGSNDKPSAKDLLMYHYGKVGALQAKAEAETDPRKLAKLDKKIENNMSATERYAYKLDKKHRPGARVLGPRTFAEIDAGRQAYVQRMQAGPSAPVRTILRTL
jgi:hypothetical protein